MQEEEMSASSKSNPKKENDNFLPLLAEEIFEKMSDQQRLSLFMKYLYSDKLGAYDDLLGKWWLDRY